MPDGSGEGADQGFGRGFGRMFGGGFGGGRGRGGGHHGRGSDGPFGGGPFGGRGGRRRMFDQNSLRLILLTLLAEEPRHGYDLIREIEARSGGVYAPSPGVVYPTLTLIADMGLAVEQPEAGGKKLYAITAEGKAALETDAEAVADAMGRLAALADSAKQSNGAPIRRSMQGLMMALRDRLSQTGADEDTMHAVAAIIDEAAQKIERLK